MTEDKEMTTVVYRRWKSNGGLIALFPTIEADMNAENCMSYETIGQHGSASYLQVIKATRPAFRGDDLKAFELELLAIGYQLNPRLACAANNYDWREMRREQLRGYLTTAQATTAL